MKAAIISTVYNEETNIEKFLESIINQSRLPDEIIIVDGGSTDKTPEIIHNWSEKYPLIRLIVKRCNIAKGRNIAIAASTSEIIATTDAGCFIDTTWFEMIVNPIEQMKAQAVSGNFTPCGSLAIQRALSIVGATRRRPQLNFPSSRSFAFLKKLWDVYAYPEYLNIHEDTNLCDEWSKRGIKFHYEPSAIVSWELESSLYKIYKKYFGYSYWASYSGDPIDKVRRCINLLYAILFIIFFIKSSLIVFIWLFYWLFRIFRGSNFQRTTRYLKIDGFVMSIIILLLLDWCCIYGTIRGKISYFVYPLKGDNK